MKLLTQITTRDSTTKTLKNVGKNIFKDFSKVLTDSYDKLFYFYSLLHCGTIVSLSATQNWAI